MSTKDILNVLQAHNREKITVELFSSKDCADFWKDFSEAVYGALPSTEINNSDGVYLYRLDYKIYCLLESFAGQDNLELVNKSGKLLKRFSKYYKEQMGFKLDDSTLGIIGDKLQYYLSKQANTYYVDFTDVIDWNDGKFGKSGSCWWGTYSESRDTFTSNGGWGIRFYDSMDDTHGIGRTWILPRDGVLLGFNSYGVDRPKVSKVIKAIFAQHGITLHYKQAEIVNSCDSTIPYINGDSGFVLYLEGIEPSDSYDLEMEVERREKCTHCGYSMDTEYGDYEIIREDYYCSECARELFSTCDRCGEWYDQDDVHRVDSESSHYEYLCEYCAKHENLTLCYECKKYTDKSITDSDGDEFCESCAESHLYYCEHCEEYYYENSFDNHDCPLNYDYSGLVECKDYPLHAKLRYDNFLDTAHITTVYKIDGCNGLAMVNAHSIDSSMDGWTITHETSGLAVKSDLTFRVAKELLQHIAFLAEWIKPADELSNDKELMQTVRSYTQG